MKKLNLLLLAVFLGGCAMGINHNVVTIDGKQYIAETPTRNFLALVQWSEETTYEEVIIDDEGIDKPATISQIKDDIKAEVKAEMQAIYNECNNTKRTSFDVNKCIGISIKSL